MTEYRFSPSTEGVFLGLSVGALMALAAGVFVTVMVLQSGALIPAILLLSLVLAYVWLPVAGTTPYGWTGPMVRRTIEVLRGRATWTSAILDPLRLPPEMGSLVIRSHDGVGLVEHRPLGAMPTYAVVLRVAGAEFPLIDAAAQNSRLAAYGRVLAGIARAGHRVQVVERTVPDDGSVQARWMGTTLDPTGPSAATYRAVADEIERQSVRHESFVTLSVAPKLRRSQRARKVPVAEQLMANAIREARILASRLTAIELVVSEPLSPEALAHALRSAVDPPFLGHSAARALSGGDPNPSIDNFGPTYRHNGFREYRTESVVHSTYRVHEWPRVPVSADWMAPLLRLRTSGIRTVTVVAEPKPPGKAIRSASNAIANIEDDSTRLAKWGFAIGAARRKAHQAAQQREAELADGYADVAFAALVTVTAADEESLDDARADVEQAGSDSHMDLRLLYNRQAQGFVASLPGAINTVPPPRWS